MIRKAYMLAALLLGACGQQTEQQAAEAAPASQAIIHEEYHRSIGIPATWKQNFPQLVKAPRPINNPWNHGEIPVLRYLNGRIWVCRIL